MARGVAKSPEEKIADIQGKKSEYQVKIDNYCERISELDKQIGELQNERQQEEVAKLLDVIQQSGKSVEEVLAAVEAAASPKDE